MFNIDVDTYERDIEEINKIFQMVAPDISCDTLPPDAATSLPEFILIFKEGAVEAIRPYAATLGSVVMKQLLDHNESGMFHFVLTLPNNVNFIDL